MSSIGFFFDSSHLQSFSFKAFEMGELGISGTDSSLIRVILGLARKKKKAFTLFYKGNAIIDDFKYNIIYVNNIEGAIDQAAFENVDYFVVNFIKVFDQLSSAIKRAENKRVKLLIWAQNPIDKFSSQLLVQSTAVEKVIYVESNDLNHTRHTKIFSKAIVIPNGIEKEVYSSSSITKPNTLNVLYLGSLTPGKGFHYLAEAWDSVIQRVPQARLVVIGSGKLYNNFAKLGPLGIADETYEKELSKYIGTTKQELEEKNIVLYGMLNRNEVIDLIKKANIGCINPSYKGSLESCSVSSLEIQMCGVPIIGGKAGGNLNTILNGKTGFLIKNPTELADSIVKLLLDRTLNERMRYNARAYVLSKYELTDIINIWLALFDKLDNNEKIKYPNISRQEFFEYKILIKEGIRILKKVL